MVFLATTERVMLARLDTLCERSANLVDAYLVALCSRRNHAGVYSFDEHTRKLGLELLRGG